MNRLQSWTCCATGQCEHVSPLPSGNGDPCFTEQAVAGAGPSGATVKKEKENRSSSRENGVCGRMVPR